MAERKYDDGQRHEVLARIDRGETIRAASLAAGVSPDAGYRWAKQAGLSNPRSRPRSYTPEEKALFLRRLAEVGDVSRVARELGFARPTCYAWAHRAGVFTSTYADDRRQEFLRLRSEGVPRAEAARELGIDQHQASDWDQGIRQFSKGRIYPDGRVVLYNQDEILAAVRRPRRTWAHGEYVPMAAVEKVIDARYLSLVERECIKDLVQQEMSIRQIAASMGRAPSTISRELKRNTVGAGGYLPHTAHRLSVKRRPRPKVARLVNAGPLQDYVAEKLAKRWSPEQITHRLRKDHPESREMHVCTETIYQAIYVHAKGQLRKELDAPLRRGRRRRKPRKAPGARTPRFIDDMAPLAERPEEVEARVIPGHWEGDLITGSQNKSAVATVVERTCRYVVLGHLPGGHDAEAVKDSLTIALGYLPDHLRRSLTWDQGAEMSGHKAFSVATNMDVYFCDPGSPWQRGTNENTNGLLRQYLPKGSNLAIHEADALAAIAAELNGRPRKSLDWDTPAERFAALLDSA